MIQFGAEIRVRKGSFGFDIEYKNPNEQEWSFYAKSFDHIKAEQTANELSKEFQRIPQTFQCEGHFPRKRREPDEVKEWMD